MRRVTPWAISVSVLLARTRRRLSQHPLYHTIFEPGHPDVLTRVRRVVAENPTARDHPLSDHHDERGAQKRLRAEGDRASTTERPPKRRRRHFITLASWRRQEVSSRCVGVWHVF